MHSDASSIRICPLGLLTGGQAVGGGGVLPLLAQKGCLSVTWYIKGLEAGAKPPRIKLYWVPPSYQHRVSLAVKNISAIIFISWKRMTNFFYTLQYGSVYLFHFSLSNLTLTAHYYFLSVTGASELISVNACGNRQHYLIPRSLVLRDILYGK